MVGQETPGKCLQGSRAIAARCPARLPALTIPESKAGQRAENNDDAKPDLRPVSATSPRCNTRAHCVLASSSLCIKGSVNEVVIFSGILLDFFYAVGSQMASAVMNMTFSLTGERFVGGGWA